MQKIGNRWFKPIGWGDISTLTGISNGNGTYTMGDMVARSSILNKFSKIKPVIHSAVGELSEDQFKSTGWGFGTNGIPSYANWSALQSALGGVSPGNVWVYQKPTGANQYRSHDFNGYVDLNGLASEWGGLGQSGNKYLYFPFAGLVSIFRDDYVIFSDTLDIVMDGYDPDQGSTGLLYLSDFAGMTSYSSGYYNYINWYLAVLLVPQGSSPSYGYLANTANTIADFTAYNVPSIIGLPFSYGSNNAEFTAGNYYIYPCICSRNFSSARFSQIFSGWGNENQGPGRLVLLDGYRLPVRIEASGTHPERMSLTVSYDVSVSGSSTTITFRVRNMTNSAITVSSNQFFCYVVAEQVFDDQYSDYITYVYNPGDAWVNSGSSDYMSDRRNGSNVVLGRYYNLYNLFYAANGNSNVLTANGTEKTFTVTIPSAVDAQGFAYNQWAQVELMYGYTLAGQSYTRRHQ